MCQTCILPYKLSEVVLSIVMGRNAIKIPVTVADCKTFLRPKEKKEKKIFFSEMRVKRKAFTRASANSFFLIDFPEIISFLL